MKKWERELRKEVELLGLSSDTLTQLGSGHYALVVEANGARKKFFFASTPSDHRGLKNKLHDIRRWVRAQEMNS